jgi:CelD/BcsL family acetyltransferase involved in cellulose biosynthesis
VRSKEPHEPHAFIALHIRADELGRCGGTLLLCNWKQGCVVENEVVAHTYDTMKTETVRTFEEFDSLRDEWNALLATSESDTIFLRHEWLSVWWKHMAEGRQLSIVIARDGKELVGVLPLAERKPQRTRMMPRVLEFLGSGIIGSDYLDAIVHRGREREVLAAFAEYLSNRALMLQLSQLRGADCTVTELTGLLIPKGWTGETAKINVCPYINLRGQTWEDYLGTLGPQVRKGIGRCLRNLPKTYGFRVDCVETADRAEKALGILIDLHLKRWGGGGKSEAFQSESVIAFHREFAQLAAQRGWLRLLILYLDDVPVSALYAFRYGSTFYFYQSGFDPSFSKQSVGVATMALAIQRAIEEGALEYDLLHGAEEYKFHWSHETRDLARIELHPPQTSAWVYRHAIAFNRAARQMARRVLLRASNVALIG